MDKISSSDGEDMGSIPILNTKLILNLSFKVLFFICFNIYRIIFAIIELFLVCLVILGCD